MEEYKPTVCAICLNVENYENCKVIEDSIKNVLNTLRLKLPIEANKDVICNTCYTKVFEAFQFKTTCIGTEDSIYPYVVSKNGAPADMEKIYLKGQDNDHLSATLKDTRICRLCMQIIDCGFIFVKNVDASLICNYIPEVNFNFTKEPVICTACLESLRTHSGFLRKCVGVQKFENVCEDEVNGGQFYIKTEEIELKSEESNFDMETPLLQGDPPDFQTESEAILKPHQLETPIYTCDTCGYQTNTENSFSTHQLRHQGLPELTAFSATCASKTEFKGSLTGHRVTAHMDNSEKQVYKCETCNYATKRRGDFNRHLLTHKNTSLMQMYKCLLCNFETKYRDSIVRHELKHKDRSEVPLHKCNECSFESKYKKSLHKHVLVHKNTLEVQMYECDTCGYETKYKGSLKLHRLVHKETSEIEMYKCEICSYETRYKSSLVSHHLVHRDISDVQMYVCLCGYKTKYKGDLVKHQRKQKQKPNDKSDMTMYVCDTCSYGTNRKANLARHMVKHRSIAKV